MRRRLSRDEAQVWARIARTVTPLAARPPRSDAADQPAPDPAAASAAVVQQPAARSAGGAVPQSTSGVRSPARPRALDSHGLDGAWEKRLARGLIAADYTLDLHGHSLDAAYLRLEHGLAQALSLGARVVLVITGRPRGAEAADRGSRRGAIRAKLLDWLAAGPYAASIAAVRGAHRRHGSAGAVYVILRRRR